MTLPLMDVWGTGANDVWAVGLGGAVVRWNGTAWSSQDNGTSEGLYSIWGSDANHVWVVGSTGTLRQWNGTT